MLGVHGFGLMVEGFVRRAAERVLQAVLCGAAQTCRLTCCMVFSRTELGRQPVRAACEQGVSCAAQRSALSRVGMLDDKMFAAVFSQAILPGDRSTPRPDAAHWRRALVSGPAAHTAASQTHTVCTGMGSWERFVPSCAALGNVQPTL